MPMRNFRPRVDIANMNGIEIMQRYRFDREGIDYLTEQITEVSSPMTNRNHSFSPKTKIITTLRYLATGHIQLNAGDMNGMSQASVSRIIEQTVSAISHPRFSSRYVRFMTTPQHLTQRKRDFYELASFPNVVGVIDGTHIQIKAPVVDEPAFVNRLGYHSINTQIVFDSLGLILDLMARWPGSTHDSRVLRNSGLFVQMERGILGAGDNYLLGDSGYPCKRWLLTPYLRPTPGSQTEYNRSHKTTRCCVERGIGQLKKRWGILQGEIRMEPAKVCKIIMACEVLHNICKMRNIPLPGEAAVPAIVEQNLGQQDQNVGPKDGLRYRDYICNAHFNV